MEVKWESKGKYEDILVDFYNMLRKYQPCTYFHIDQIVRYNHQAH